MATTHWLSRRIEAMSARVKQQPPLIHRQTIPIHSTRPNSPNRLLASLCSQSAGAHLQRPLSPEHPCSGRRRWLRRQSILIRCTTMRTCSKLRRVTRSLLRC